MINVQNLLPVWILCGWCGARDQACIRAIRKLVAQHGPRDTIRARLPDKMVGIDTTKPWTHNTSWYRHAIHARYGILHSAVYPFIAAFWTCVK